MEQIAHFPSSPPPQQTFYIIPGLGGQRRGAGLGEDRLFLDIGKSMTLGVIRNDNLIPIEAILSHFDSQMPSKWITEQGGLRKKHQPFLLPRREFEFALSSF